MHPFGSFDIDRKAIECERFGRRFGLDQFVLVQSKLGFGARLIETKAYLYLSLRVEFGSGPINELLRIPDED